MTKTASTDGLQKAMQNKPSVQGSTGIDPYKKAQSYLKAMIPAISEALPRSKGMDAERLARLTMTTLKLNPKLLECSIESLLGAVLQSAQFRTRTKPFRKLLLYPVQGYSFVSNRIQRSD